MAWQKFEGDDPVEYNSAHTSEQDEPTVTGEKSRRGPTTTFFAESMTDHGVKL